MQYKNRKVSIHRYKQLVKTRKNHRKMMDGLLSAFYPSAKREWKN